MRKIFPFTDMDRKSYRRWRFRVGLGLFKARQKLHWTPDRLAEESGVSRKQIDRLEIGGGHPTMLDIFLLSRTLKRALAEYDKWRTPPKTQD